MQEGVVIEALALKEVPAVVGVEALVVVVGPGAKVPEPHGKGRDRQEDVSGYLEGHPGYAEVNPWCFGGTCAGPGVRVWRPLRALPTVRTRIVHEGFGGRLRLGVFWH